MKYRLLGVIASSFLFLAAVSSYNVFLLSGLTFNRSTIFGAISLLLLSQITSLNWLKLTKQFLLTKSYTTKIAIILANKKNNTYIYELALLFLIPGAFFIFLLPTSLKELGIVIILGLIVILIFWMVISNLYFPRLISSLKDRKALLSGDAWASSKNYEISSLAHKQELIKTSLENSGKLVKPSINFVPLIMFVSFIGLILWLFNFELVYPKFFKGNKLLSLDSNTQKLIDTQLKGISGQYKEFKQLPSSVATQKGREQANSLGWNYYLFPETVDLTKIMEELQKKNRENGSQGTKQSTVGAWELQNTDAFSIMPALKKSLKLIFWSMLPLSGYSIFRFGVANTLSFVFSAFALLGMNFLFFLGTGLTISNLFPEIIIISFLILLAFWIQFILMAKKTAFPGKEDEDKLKFFREQALQIKKEMKMERMLHFGALLSACGLTIFFRSYEIFYSVLLLLISLAFIYVCFIPVQSAVWARMKFYFLKHSFKVVKYFLKTREKERRIVEEENVYGINL